MYESQFDDATQDTLDFVAGISDDTADQYVVLTEAVIQLAMAKGIPQDVFADMLADAVLFYPSYNEPLKDFSPGYRRVAA